MEGEQQSFFPNESVKSVLTCIDLDLDREGFACLNASTSVNNPITTTAKGLFRNDFVADFDII